MYRLIKFVMDFRDYGLKIKPTIQEINEIFWRILQIFTDSNWEADINNRKSITGFAMFLLGVPVLWKS
jgi:hypothetical protein